MNWKVVLLMFVIFFASAVTIVTTSFNVPKLVSFSASERITLDRRYEPAGDPIESPGAPN